MIRLANEWAKQLGGIKDSIVKGKGNAAGRLGELALCKHLGVEVADHKDHDLIYNSEKLEVKTKRRTVAPLPHYDVSVAKTSRHQLPDRYVFISLEFSGRNFYGEAADGLKRRGGVDYYGLKNVWYCGDMLADEYFQKARLFEKGDKDESNNFTTLVDMYNLRIDELQQSF